MLRLKVYMSGKQMDVKFYLQDFLALIQLLIALRKVVSEVKLLVFKLIFKRSFRKCYY